jgi:hypothetical protein
VAARIARGWTMLRATTNAYVTSAPVVVTGVVSTTIRLTTPSLQRSRDRAKTRNSWEQSRVSLRSASLPALHCAHTREDADVIRVSSLSSSLGLGGDVRRVRLVLGLATG